MPTDAMGASRPTPLLLVLRSALCFGAASLLVAILLGVGATPVAVGLVPAPWDKLAHVAAYAALGLFLAAGFSGRRPVLATSLACAVGIIDELMQAVHPGRHADFADFGADLAGALLAATLYSYLRGRRD